MELFFKVMQALAGVFGFMCLLVVPYYIGFIRGMTLQEKKHRALFHKLSDEAYEGFMGAVAKGDFFMQAVPDKELFDKEMA